MDTKPTLLHHDITDKVISSFFSTYNELAGFPEFVLRRAMAIAIRDDGLSVEEEKPLPVWFRGYQIVKFRADMVVASTVIVEVKTRPEIDPFNKAQVLHYLKATDLEVGLATELRPPAGVPQGRLRAVAKGSSIPSATRGCCESTS